MYKIVKEEIDQSIWKQNPELKLFPPCRELIKKVGQEEASILTWVAYLMYHPQSSFARTTVDFEQRFTYIISNFDIDLSLNQFEEEYGEYVDEFLNIILSKHQKMFRMWDDRLDKITAEVIKRDTTEKTVALMLKVDKVAEAIQKAKDLMLSEEDDNSSSLYGQGYEGFAERRSRIRKSQAKK